MFQDGTQISQHDDSSRRGRPESPYNRIEPNFHQYEIPKPHLAARLAASGRSPRSVFSEAPKRHMGQVSLDMAIHDYNAAVDRLIKVSQPLYLYLRSFFP